MAQTWQLQGGRQLEARLRAMGRAPEEMLREIGIRGVAEAKKTVPRKTGNLGRTIRLGTVSRTEVSIRAGGALNVGYAAAVEFGSRPHVIRPKKARVLAWGGSRTLGGRLSAGSRPTNFAMSVNHPGTKPQPFLLPGFEKALRIVGLGKLVEKWNEAA